MKKRTVFKICIAIYMAVVIIAATILAVVSADRLVFSCHTTHIGEDVYAYWQTQQRYRYLQRHASDGAQDTAFFWSLPAGDGTERTHGEVVEDTTREYAEYVAAAVYLYDAMGHELSDTAMGAIEEYFSEKVTYSFDGDEKAYEREAEKYGFSLSAAKTAEVMVRKMQLLREYITADAVQQDAYYAEKYVRVKLLYIRENDASYESKCEMIRFALAAEDDSEALVAGTDDFSRAVQDAFYNADETARENAGGYYFAPASQFTNDTHTTLPEVVEAALALEDIGDSRELTVTVQLENGTTETRTYFLRRYALDTLAYGEEKNAMFFGDFVSLATDYYFFEWCDAAREDIVWRAKNVREWIPCEKAHTLYKFF